MSERQHRQCRETHCTYELGELRRCCLSVHWRVGDDAPRHLVWHLRQLQELHVEQQQPPPPGGAWIDHSCGTQSTGGS